MKLSIYFGKLSFQNHFYAENTNRTVSRSTACLYALKDVRNKEKSYSGCVYITVNYVDNKHNFIGMFSKIRYPI